MNRRQFLSRAVATGAAAAAAFALDPERALWVPGAKTFFLPSKEIVQAKTMAEAISRGLVALFPDGSRLELAIGLPHSGLTIEQLVQAEIRDIERAGGRIVERRKWDSHQVREWDISANKYRDEMTTEERHTEFQQRGAIIRPRSLLFI